MTHKLRFNYSNATYISSKLKITLLNCFNRSMPSRPSRDEDTVPFAGTVAGRSSNSAEAVPIVSLNSGTFTISSRTVPPCPHTFCVSTGSAAATSAFLANQRSDRLAPLAPVSSMNVYLFPLASVDSTTGIFVSRMIFLPDAGNAVV